ncbi:MAG: zinc ribbon domain-containing protein [Oscillospiraceae bacterium]|jgi:heme/copper-type cytochrome/quinol oxidase subunit 2|nr:zinc ribbon domain-containing protein [Oscillospiraceae bacterium]
MYCSNCGNQLNPGAAICTNCGANVPNLAAGAGGNSETPVSVGEWMLMALIMMIPLVGLVMMFVWAFGANEKKSKSNWAKASLIWAAIYIGLTIIISIALVAAGISFFDYLTMESIY